MTSLAKRIRKLEARADLRSPERTQETIRVTVQPVCGRANLATSQCNRMLTNNGVLTEFVELDGSDEGLSKEELDRFVASFPVHNLVGGSARW